jgi:hypothetical protein
MTITRYEQRLAATQAGVGGLYNRRPLAPVLQNWLLTRLSGNGPARLEGITVLDHYRERRLSELDPLTRTIAELDPTPTAPIPEPDPTAELEVEEPAEELEPPEQQPPPPVQQGPASGQKVERLSVTTDELAQASGLSEKQLRAHMTDAGKGKG